MPMRAAATFTSVTPVCESSSASRQAARAAPASDVANSAISASLARLGVLRRHASPPAPRRPSWTDSRVSRTCSANVSSSVAPSCSRADDPLRAVALVEHALDRRAGSGASPCARTSGAASSISSADALGGGHGAPRAEVDQLAARARAGSPATGSPRARARRTVGGLALVDPAQRARGHQVAEGRERDRLAHVGRAVGVAQLDRPERLVRAHAPPDLRVLADRAGVEQEAHERVVLAPAGERLGDAAAREHAREVLRARRVQERHRDPRTTASCALSASRSGRIERRRFISSIARSAPCTPTCTWMPNVLLRQAT